MGGWGPGWAALWAPAGMECPAAGARGGRGGGRGQPPPRPGRRQGGGGWAAAAQGDRERRRGRAWTGRARRARAQGVSRAAAQRRCPRRTCRESPPPPTHPPPSWSAPLPLPPPLPPPDGSKASLDRAGRDSEGLIDCVFDVEALPHEPAAGEGRAALLLQRPEEAHALAVGGGDGHNLPGPRPTAPVSEVDGRGGAFPAQSECGRLCA